MEIIKLKNHFLSVLMAIIQRNQNNIMRDKNLQIQLPNGLQRNS